MSDFLLQCIVGCIFYSFGLIIPRKSPCIRCDQLKNKSSRRVTYGNPCYSIGSKANSIYFLNDRSVFSYICTYYRGHPKVNVFFFNSLIFTLNHWRPKMSKFDTSVKKLLKLFFLNATSHSDSDS
jgi:hypothetical protein